MVSTHDRALSDFILSRGSHDERFKAFARLRSRPFSRPLVKVPSAMPNQWALARRWLKEDAVGGGCSLYVDERGQKWFIKRVVAVVKVSDPVGATGHSPPPPLKIISG